MRLKIILVSAALIGILIAGCGSDSSSSSGSTSDPSSTTPSKSNDGGSSTTKSKEVGNSKPLTKSELNLKMNEICIQVPPAFEEELEELKKEIGKPPTKAEENLKAALPPLVTAYESMEELTPSAAEAEDLEGTIAALKSAVKGVEEEPKAKLSGPSSPFAEFQAKAKELSYESCEGL
jgi:hypothetical protein